ncbi:MAG: polysaccharide deacetylase family protein [Planctomycetota bacterium]|jgi:peptidoglycan/xylan/chitin deacetylase (PgdA/CDA1 family)
MFKSSTKSILLRSIVAINKLTLSSQSKNIIISLHIVTDVPPANSQDFSVMRNFRISTDFFRSLLALLKSECNIVTVQEMLSNIKTGEKKPMVAITFDDGFVDCYKTAFPILKHMKVPAGVYLNPSFIDNPRLPREYLLESCLKNFSGKLQIDTHKKKLTFFINHNTDRYKTFISLMSLLNESDNDQINYIITQVCDQRGFSNDTDYANPLFLTWDMAREMLSSGLIYFGNHGLNHLPLGSLSQQELKMEILDSHKMIKKELAIEPVGFSFPYGRKTHYNRTAIKILKDNGYTYALTTQNRAITKNQDPFTLPRIHIDESEGLSGYQARQSALFRIAGFGS